jgi:acetylornithine deacetylase/succinyl-diaminopimelate desuccinylase-like protein
MAHVPDDPTAEVTDVLRLLIRNQCVNDGTVTSGGEARSVDLLEGYLAGVGDRQVFEPQPGRQSLVVRIEGTDPTAPSLLLMGHTDVVPVNPDGWTRDPFAGDVVDGFVWGRGAVDMLNLTASQAVAFKRLAESGFRPKGDLLFLAVADEEALGTWGAHWLLDHEREAVYADYVLTESGGIRMPTPRGPRLNVLVGEKGTFWTKITVGGTPSHGSQPFRTDNALITAAEVVRRIAEYHPPAQIHDAWRRYVRGLELDDELTVELLDPEGLERTLPDLPMGMSRLWHACTHTTFAPTVAHGGTKTNIIPDRVELQVDIRTLPGQTGADATAMLRDALGDLADSVHIESNDDGAPQSPVDTPLWDSLARVSGALCTGSALVPMLTVFGTDNRFFRRAGAVGYGFGLFSDRLGFDDFTTMFHGNDERVDQESLALSTLLWEAVARDLLG